MQAGPGKQVSQEQWLQHYALRDDLVCESWLSAAERSDKHEPQCRATWRALGHLASVDVPQISLRTAHGDEISRLDCRCRRVGSNDRGNSELAADDRRMARAPTSVRDNG